MNILRIEPRNTPLAARTRRGRSCDVVPATTSVRRRNYGLNKKNAIVKKLSHTDRVSLKVWTKEGGVRGTFSAAFFEIFRCAAQQYYKTIRDGIQCTCTPVYDQTGANMVEIRYTVRSGSTKHYVLNLYLTASGMLINGTNANMFVDTDLPAITSIAVSHMNGSADLFQLFSQNVKAELCGLLENYSENLINTAAQLKNYRTSLINAATYIPRVDTTDIADAEETSCLRCDSPCIDNSVYCDVGEHWVHYPCETLSRKRPDASFLSEYIYTGTLEKVIGDALFSGNHTQPHMESSLCAMDPCAMEWAAHRSMYESVNRSKYSNTHTHIYT
jgi:hypothetical protein